MKPANNLTSRLAWAVIVIFVLSAVVPAAAGPRAEAQAPARAPQASPQHDPGELFETAVEHALQGRMALSLEEIRKAASATPGDSRLLSARDLLEQYLRGWDQVRMEREADYRDAVRRVEWYMIAQRHLPELDGTLTEAHLLETEAPGADDATSQPATGPARTLSQRVADVLRAANDAPTREQLEGADADEAADLRDDALHALADVSQQLVAVGEHVSGQTGEYAVAMQTILADLHEAIDAYADGWREVRLDDDTARLRAVEVLAPLEHELADALGDLRAMVYEQPWRLALSQARLARLLAEDKDALAEQTWFRQFVTYVENRAENAVAEARWYDALSAFGGLDELVPDNEDYRDSLGAIRRHVRVLELYGGGDDGEDDAHWKKIVENVDADMVEKVIRRLGAAYVTAVDFREVTLGGLEGVRILAETPQVAETFEGLADESAREAFLAAIEREAANVRARDRVDHEDLQLALIGVLQSSERTVEIPTEVLAVEFTDGFLQELDQFSSMIWPYNVRQFNKNTRGQFTGVGIQITKEPQEPLRVVTPLAGSPAYRAGIKKDDLILAVDGQPTKDESIEDLVDRIMGKPGTKVTLRIRREGLLKPIDVPIVREQISIRTVKGWRREPGTGEWSYLLDADEGIGYIRIDQFTEETSRRVREALEQIEQAGAHSVVLDMRFNPGGLLTEATSVVDEFLAGGRIVSTRGRQTKPIERRAGRGGSFLGGDLVVLTNEHSASAAEIVSGALQDWGRATVIGERTYGKGSVQNVIGIPQHRAYLKLTTAYYYLPKGRLLHRRPGHEQWGVDPDVEVFVSPAQIKRWMEVRSSTDLLQEISEAELSRQLQRQYEADIQLRAAVMLLKLSRLQKEPPAADVARAA